MSKQIINVGAAADDRTGDTWRDAMVKSNANFTELYQDQIPLTSKQDFIDNGTLAVGIITMNPGTYDVFGNIDLVTDVLFCGGGILFLGNMSGQSSITTNSSSPTITFGSGGFASSGIQGRLGFGISNTGTGAAVRAQDTGTIASIVNAITFAAGNGLEINNATGVRVDAWRMTSGVTNGIVITGAVNFSPFVNSLNLANVTGKGIDIQGNIVFGSMVLSNALIDSVGVGLDISGTVIGLNGDGLINSSGAAAINISGTILGSLSLFNGSFTSSTDEAIDIRGSSITSGLITDANINSTGAGKSAIIADATVNNASPNIIGALTVANSRASPGAGGVALSGIEKTNINVTFNTVDGVTDSTTLGCFTLDSQATTTINFQGVDGAITAYADAGGGSTTVTSAGHGMGNGEPVAIIGTVAYNGLFVTAATTANTFDIVRAFVTDEATGDFESGWEKIAGSTTDCPTIERFMGSDNNELEYLAAPTIPVTYSAIIAGQKSGATVQGYQFAVFFNTGSGFVKINGSIPGDLTNRAATIPLRIPAEAKTGDKFTAYVRNIDASSDFICDALTVDVAFS